jgi:hypothetical protein
MTFVFLRRDNICFAVYFVIQKVLMSKVHVGQEPEID